MQLSYTLATINFYVHFLMETYPLTYTPTVPKKYPNNKINSAFIHSIIIIGIFLKLISLISIIIITIP